MTQVKHFIAFIEGQKVKVNLLLGTNNRQDLHYEIDVMGFVTRLGYNDFWNLKPVIIK